MTAMTVTSRKVSICISSVGAAQVTEVVTHGTMRSSSHIHAHRFLRPGVATGYLDGQNYARCKSLRQESPNGEINCRRSCRCCHLVRCRNHWQLDSTSGASGL